MAEQAQAAVLVLLWGRPPHVLLERKACNVNRRFACDLAYPGGRIAPGETPEQTALREAWEEAWVHPSAVKVIGRLGTFHTMSKPVIFTEAVLGVASGPLDPRPRDPEVDAVFWVGLDRLQEPTRVLHPVRGYVEGILLGRDLVLWGLSLRITLRLLEVIKGSREPDLEQRGDGPISAFKA
ncbi:MAG: NUDIX hydrolase [Acidilobus sp.]